jgi:hypothetical protein
MSSIGTLASSNFERGRRLLCANIVDLAFAGAARGRGPAPIAAPGLLAGHKPPPATRGGGTASGLSTEHGPRRAAHGGGPTAIATSGLSAGHEPLRVARGPTVVAGPSLSAGHGPLRTIRGRSLAAVVGLWWTCGQR